MTTAGRPRHRHRPRAPAGCNGRDIRAGFCGRPMGPKVSAAMEFAEATGKPAAISKLDDAVEIVRGERRTRFEADARLAQPVDGTACAPAVSK